MLESGTVRTLFLSSIKSGQLLGLASKDWHQLPILMSLVLLLDSKRWIRLSCRELELTFVERRASVDRLHQVKWIQGFKPPHTWRTLMIWCVFDHSLSRFDQGRRLINTNTCPFYRTCYGMFLVIEVFNLLSYVLCPTAMELFYITLFRWTFW